MKNPKKLIFISHINEDSPIAFWLSDWLKTGIFGEKCTVFSSTDIPAGENWVESMKRAVVLQKESAREEDPVRRYFDYLRTAITSGMAHVRDRKSGGMPDGKVSCGWEPLPANSGMPYRPKGSCIGWIEGVSLSPLSPLSKSLLVSMRVCAPPCSSCP